MERFVLYLFTLGGTFVCTYAILPLLTRVLGPHLLDKPGGLKKHEHTVPIVGGCGIFMGWCAILIVLRLVTQFPSGTLHSLRGIFIGGMLIFAMGLTDDFFKPKGVGVWTKLAVQISATACLIYYGILIRVFPSPWLAYPLTFLWVVGLTNAFNLLDISDGLCTTQVIVCTLGLVFIALPGEYIYVNFAALALLGACCAFLPFNFSSKQKLFLGDSGSNFLGFLIAALCLGTDYSNLSDWGFWAPLLIVFVPIADISFVTLARVLQGKNPLKGSEDHAAVRLKKRGWPPVKILSAFIGAACISNIGAFLITFCSPTWVIGILGLATSSALLISYWLLYGGNEHAR